MTATVAMEYRFRYNVELWGPEAYQPYLQILEQGQMAFAGVTLVAKICYIRCCRSFISGIIYRIKFT